MACAHFPLWLRRTGRWRLRAPVFAAFLALAPLAAACSADPPTACGDAYEHLLTLGHRNHDPELRARFLKSCVEAWDKKKVACLQAAETADEALACDWFKKRPG